jgi:hypothetical protein
MGEENVPFTLSKMNILWKDCNAQACVSSGFSKFVVNLIEHQIPQALIINTDV